MQSQLSLSLYLDDEGQEVYNQNPDYLKDEAQIYRIRFQNETYLLLTKHLSISGYLKQLVENAVDKKAVQEVVLHFGRDAEAFDLNMRLIYGMLNVNIPQQLLVQTYIIAEELKINYGGIAFLNKSTHNKLQRAVVQAIDEHSIIKLLEMAWKLNNQEITSACKARLKTIDYNVLKNKTCLINSSEKTFQLVMTMHSILVRESYHNNQDKAKLLSLKAVMEVIGHYCGNHYNESKMKEEKMWEFQESFLVFHEGDSSVENSVILHNFKHKLEAKVQVMQRNAEEMHREFHSEIKQSSESLRAQIFSEVQKAHEMFQSETKSETETTHKMLTTIRDKFEEVNEKINTLTGRLNTMEVCVKNCSDSQAEVKKKVDESLLRQRLNANPFIKYQCSAHRGSILKLILISNESKYVTCSADKSIQIYSAQTGQLMRKLQGHNDGVRDIIMLSNGQLASCSDDNSIKIWDITEGECIKTLNGHNDWVTAIHEGPNSILISGSLDKTVRLWDLKTTNLVCSPLEIVQNHDQLQVGTHALCLINSDEFAIGSAADINIYKIKQPAELTLVKKLTGHFDWVRGLQTIKNKEVLLSVSLDKICMAWNIANGQCIRTFTGHSDGVFGLAVISDDIFVTSSREVNVWNLQFKVPMKTIFSYDCINHIVAKDFKFFTCGTGNVVSIYEY